MAQAVSPLVLCLLSYSKDNYSALSDYVQTAFWVGKPEKVNFMSYLHTSA